MRVALLLVGVGCFNPDVKRNLPCNQDQWCPPPEMCIAGTCRADDDNAPNFAFVTSDVRKLSLQSRVDMDNWCRDHADAAGMTGDFIAWISTPAQAVRRRIEMAAARGWIRADGKPFADTIEDIVAGNTYYPLRIANDGRDVSASDENVATGTEASGEASTDACGGFSPTSIGSVKIGKADAGAVSWTAAAADDCAKEAHVYCFGVSRAIAVTIPPLAVTQKRAFVTKNTYSKRPPADADTICNNEAGGGTKFVALLATTAQSVQERFMGITGPWFRIDGVLLTDDMSSFLAPLEVTLDGMHVRGEVWFGAKTLIDRGVFEKNCDDWTVGGSVRTGNTDRSVGAAPFDSQNRSCGDQYRYYCAER